MFKNLKMTSTCYKLYIKNMKTIENIEKKKKKKKEN